MSEFSPQPSPEQLMLGGLLALMIDRGLDFETGYFEYDDIGDILAGVVGALYEIGEDAGELLKDYGVIEGDER